MTRARLSAIAVVGLLVVATAAAQAATGKRFHSRRYQYSVLVLPGWRITPATATATLDTFPWRDDPTSDKFDSPGVTAPANELRIAAITLPTGTSRSGWTAQVVNNVKNRLHCQPDRRSATTVGGEAATYLLYRSCSGRYFPVIAVVHGQSGYIVYWLSSRTTVAQADSTFRRLVGSLEFAP